MNQEKAFAELLRAWRKARRLTQLELALDAGISQRHLSFLESGRSRPSREMILKLAEALDLPLRERNQLLDNAGYSAEVRERPLQGEGMGAVREALTMLLEHHDPYPAIVVDRDWNLLMANTAQQRLFDLFGNIDELWAATCPNGVKNVIRLTLHPTGLRKYCLNWEELLPWTTTRLRRDAKLTGSAALVAMIDELKTYPELAAHWSAPIVNVSPQPVFSMVLGNESVSLSLFSMISTFGTPQDVTTDELRVEQFFPADESSATLLRRLAE